MIRQVKDVYVDTLHQLSKLTPEKAVVVHVGEDGSTHIGNGVEFKTK